MSKARFIETANHVYPSTSCLPNIVFGQAVVGASLDAYHYSVRRSSCCSPRPWRSWPTCRRIARPA